jgi:hypothetical protein
MYTNIKKKIKNEVIDIGGCFGEVWGVLQKALNFT